MTSAKSTDGKFDRFDDLLDTEFENKELTEEMHNVIEKRKELIIKKDVLVDKDVSKLEIQDAEYLVLELKTTVESLEVVMAKLEESLKTGTGARDYEVYSTLANVKVNTLKELREVNKMLYNWKKDVGGIKDNNTKGVNNLTINLTPSQLSEYIQEVKSNNSLNDIDADFDLGDGK